MSVCNPVRLSRLRGAGVLLRLRVAAAAAAVWVQAMGWTVSFDPAEPANTNGWDFGATVENARKSGTQPGGRKFVSGKGESSCIESGVFGFRVYGVEIETWGSGINSGNQSALKVWGRGAEGGDYRLMFERVGLSNTLSGNDIKFGVPKDLDCRQVRIEYVKDIGTLTVSRVTLEDVEPAVPGAGGLRCEKGGGGGNVRVAWEMPEGYGESELMVWTESVGGGLGESETIWREPFVNETPPAGQAQEVKFGEGADLGMYFAWGGWSGERVYPFKEAGVMQVGVGDERKYGTLTTPQIDLGAVAGEKLLVIRSRFVDAEVALDATERFFPLWWEGADGVRVELGSNVVNRVYRERAIELPAGLGSGKIGMHSVTNRSDTRVALDEVAVVAKSAYVGQYVQTNGLAVTEFEGGVCSAVVAPEAGKATYCAVRVRDGERWSEWSGAIVVAEPEEEFAPPANRLRGGECEVTVDGLDSVTGESARVTFYLGGEPVEKITENKNAANVTQVGIYECTNSVNGLDWFAIVPKSDGVAEAEMRVVFEAGENKMRELEVEGDFAQLGCRNKSKTRLAIEYRVIAADGVEGEWVEAGAYESTYTKAEAGAVDLPGTVARVKRRVELQARRGGRLEVRLHSKKQDGVSEPPLGFRNVRFAVKGTMDRFVFTVK